MTKTSGKRIKNKANVGAASGVIGDEEHWTFEIGEILPATNARMSEEKRGRPGKRVINEKPKKAHGGALRPAGIDVVRAADGGLREEFLNLGEGLRVGELRFVEFDVVAVLEGGEKFDAVKRRKVFEGGGEGG